MFHRRAGAPVPLPPDQERLIIVGVFLTIFVLVMAGIIITH